MGGYGSSDDAVFQVRFSTPPLFFVVIKIIIFAHNVVLFQCHNCFSFSCSQKYAGRCKIL